MGPPVKLGVEGRDHGHGMDAKKKWQVAGREMRGDDTCCAASAFGRLSVFRRAQLQRLGDGVLAASLSGERRELEGIS